MRRVMAVMMAVLFCWCFTASAQEQRGVIEGVVKDASGAVLPGVTVEAKAENGAVISTVTDPTGTYRFPSVAPGGYAVTATMSGFQPQSLGDVRVGLGQVKKVDFALDGRRRDRVGQHLRRVAAGGRETVGPPDQHPGGAGRAPAEGARLHHAGHAGGRGQ